MMPAAFTAILIWIAATSLPPLPSISTLRPGGDTKNASPANYLMGLHSLQDKPQSLLYCVECFRKQNLLKEKQHISSKRKEIMSD